MKTFLTFSGVALLSVASLFAQTPQQQYEAGKAALERHDLDKAVELLESAVAKSPQNADYHFSLGEAYGQQAMSASMFKAAGLATKTRTEMERAVELNPNHVNARWGLMQFYLMAPGFMGGSDEKALQQAGEIAKRDAYMGHRARATIYTRQKKNDLARNEMLAAVREEPNSARAHTGLASYLANSEKNFKAAGDEIAVAIKLDPNYMPAWFRLGQFAASSGTNFAEGEQALRKYLTYKPKETEPGIASAWYYLGLILEKQGKKADAKAAFMTASKMTGGADKNVQEALKRVS